MKPRVILNMVTSIDGKATVDGKVGDLTGPADQEQLLRLRRETGCVLVGAGTARNEGYSQLLPEGEDQPLCVIVSHSGNPGPSIWARAIRRISRFSEWFSASFNCTNLDVFSTVLPSVVIDSTARALTILFSLVHYLLIYALLGCGPYSVLNFGLAAGFLFYLPFSFCLCLVGRILSFGVLMFLFLCGITWLCSFPFSFFSGARS